MRAPARARPLSAKRQGLGEEKQAGLWGTDLGRMSLARTLHRRNLPQPLHFGAGLFQRAGPQTRKSIHCNARQTAPAAGGAAALEVPVFCPTWDRAHTELPTCRALGASLCPPMVPRALVTPGEGGLLIGEVGKES